MTGIAQKEYIMYWASADYSYYVFGTLCVKISIPDISVLYDIFVNFLSPIKQLQENSEILP
jgi:hypothetical protein